MALAAMPDNPRDVILDTASGATPEEITPESAVLLEFTD
jgi:hypothetical protein